MVPRLTFRQLWLGLAVILPGLASMLASLSTVDLAWHLRAGGEILAGRGIPGMDSWTFTLGGQPWLDQQWGAQVILALVFQAAGWTGLVLLRAVLISAAWGCLVLALCRTAPSLSARWVAGLALGAFAVAAPALALRPQLFGILLLCVTLLLLVGRRADPRSPWGIPLVVVAWANLHGSFLLALVLLGLAWLDDLRTTATAARRTLAVGVAAALASLANPFGPSIIAYAVSVSANRELAARVTEWQPPSPTEPTGLLFFGSLAAVAVLLIRRRRPPPAAAALTMLAFAGLGLATARGVAWWPAVAAVTLAGLLQHDVVARQAPDLSPSGSARQAVHGRPVPPPAARAANAALLIALVLGAAVLLPAWRAVDPDLGLGAPQGLLAQAPPGITRELRTIARTDDRVWNPQPWGSWLELAVPAARVAFDSRIELVPAALWADHDAVIGVRPDWAAILDRWGVTIVVVSQEQIALRDALGASSGWRRVQQDGDGAIFVRADRERRVAALPDSEERTGRFVLDSASPILYRR